jgi:hypothetical protein
MEIEMIVHGWEDFVVTILNLTKLIWKSNMTSSEVCFFFSYSSPPLFPIIDRWWNIK